MSIHTDELRTRRLESLITPSELAHAFPLSDTVAQNLLDARREVEAILAGEDQRLLVIVGPCSIHDPLPPTSTPCASMPCASSIKRACAS